MSMEEWINVRIGPLVETENVKIKSETNEKYDSLLGT